MIDLLDSISNIVNKVSGWINSALKKLSDYLKRERELKRQREIERLVLKLWRLNAAWRISVDDLDYIQKVLKRDNRTYIWEVDYKHKYLFGRDD